MREALDMFNACIETLEPTFTELRNHAMDDYDAVEGGDDPYFLQRKTDCRNCAYPICGSLMDRKQLTLH